VPGRAVSHHRDDHRRRRQSVSDLPVDEAAADDDAETTDRVALEQLALAFLEGPLPVAVVNTHSGRVVELDERGPIALLRRRQDRRPRPAGDLG
jgi:hypothetical protein